MSKFHATEIDVTLQENFDLHNYSPRRVFRIRGKVTENVVFASLPSNAQEMDAGDIAVALRDLGFSAVAFVPRADPEVVPGVRQSAAGQPVATS